MREPLDATKMQLVEALAAANKAGLRWKRCLLVGIEGFGMYSHSAAEEARAEWERSIDNVKSILSPVVAATGLLAEGISSSRSIESVTFESDGERVTLR